MPRADWYGSAAFLFADPPFNIGHNYRGFNDRRSKKKFRKWIRKLMRSAWGAIDAERGVLALHGPDDLAELYLRYAADLEFSANRIAWVNWHYRFGQCRRSNWIDARCHCIIFAKSPGSHTWNPDAVSVESDRSSKYNDKRTERYANGGRRVPGTIWGVPSDGPFWGRVTGNSKERRAGHPNQLPELYLERLIRAYTNAGDLVVDPFAGSGTTAVVGRELGRNVVTYDISAESTASVRERLTVGAVRANNGA
jgi:site-specific DNA-methyltransferase (adenine-specific)